MLDTYILSESYNVGVHRRPFPGVDGITVDTDIKDCELLVHAKALRELPPDRFDKDMRDAREGFLMALVYAWLAGVRTREARR